MLPKNMKSNNLSVFPTPCQWLYVCTCVLCSTDWWSRRLVAVEPAVSCQSDRKLRHTSSCVCVCLFASTAFERRLCVHIWHRDSLVHCQGLSAGQVPLRHETCRPAGTSAGNAGPTLMNGGNQDCAFVWVCSVGVKDKSITRVQLHTVNLRLFK